jgi:peroxiredoxin (alkyl hydroperoxide reductase subunit C)
LAAVAAKYNDFKKEGAEILAISTDKIFSHKIWHDISPRVKKVAFTMLEDPNGEISKKYGVYAKGGLSYRAVYIIDNQRIIQAVTIHNIPIGRNIKEIYRVLKAAQYSKKHPLEGVPANWQPGDKGVPTGIDYVGKF